MGSHGNLIINIPTILFYVYLSVIFIYTVRLNFHICCVEIEPAVLKEIPPLLTTYRGFHEKGTYSYLCSQG